MSLELLSGKLKEGTFVQDQKDFTLRLEIRKTSFGWMINGFVKGRPRIVEIYKATSPGIVLVNNWQSWGPCAVVDSSSYKAPPLNPEWQYSASLHPELIKENILVSDYFVATQERLYGFLTSKIAHPFFTIKDGTVSAALDFSDLTFTDYVPLEPLAVFERKDIFQALEEYATLISQENNVQIRKHNPIGWCSWYQYFLNLSWQELLKNLSLAQYYPFDVFQIDDGYEQDIGDWLESKSGFPSLEEMAQRIKDHGFKPGVWTAPFSLSEQSKLFNSHKDWVVKENSCPKMAYKNWNKSIYALDLSNNEVKQWLFETFSTLYRMGYRYFKIDFLFAGALPGMREKPVTPVQAFREGMQIIRKAVRDSFILGCGSPLLPAAGYVDGMRIGPDTAPYWGNDLPDTGGPAAKWALRNAITRYFMHKKLWLNDPDCLLLRNLQTELSSEERKIYAYTCGLLDNMIFVSDDLSLIDEEGKKIFMQTLRLTGGKARLKEIISEAAKYSIEIYGTKTGNFRFDVDLDKKQFNLEALQE